MQAFSSLNPFVRLILIIVGIGLLVWLLNFLPLPAPFPTIILVVAILGVIVLVIQTFIKSPPA